MWYVHRWLWMRLNGCNLKIVLLVCAAFLIYFSSHVWSILFRPLLLKFLLALYLWARRILWLAGCSSQTLSKCSKSPLFTSCYPCVVYIFRYHGLSPLEYEYPGILAGGYAPLGAEQKRDGPPQLQLPNKDRAEQSPNKTVPVSIIQALEANLWMPLSELHVLEFSLIHLSVFLGWAWSFLLESPSLQCCKNLWVEIAQCTALFPDLPRSVCVSLLTTSWAPPVESFVP